VNLWAFDHVCLFGLEFTQGRRRGRSVQQG